MGADNFWSSKWRTSDRVCRSADAGVQMQECRCRSADTGVQTQECRRRSADAVVQTQECRRRSADAGVGQRTWLQKISFGHTMLRCSNLYI